MLLSTANAASMLASYVWLELLEGIKVFILPCMTRSLPDHFGAIVSLSCLLGQFSSFLVPYAQSIEYQGLVMTAEKADARTIYDGRGQRWTLEEANQEWLIMALRLSEEGI